MSIINISGDHYEILTAQEAEDRRREFINNPGDGLDNFSRLFGRSYANQYFEKFFNNLKYQDIKKYPDLFNCPCIYRQKFNPTYVCYGVRCPHRKKSLEG